MFITRRFVPRKPVIRSVKVQTNLRRENCAVQRGFLVVYGKKKTSNRHEQTTLEITMKIASFRTCRVTTLVGHRRLRVCTEIRLKNNVSGKTVCGRLTEHQPDCPKTRVPAQRSPPHPLLAHSELMNENRWYTDAKVMLRATRVTGPRVSHGR